MFRSVPINLILIVLLMNKTKSGWADLDFRIRRYIEKKRSCEQGTSITGTSVYRGVYKIPCQILHYCLEYTEKEKPECVALYKKKMITVCDEQFSILGRISCRIKARTFAKRVLDDEDYEDDVNLEDVPKFLLCSTDNPECVFSKKKDNDGKISFGVGDEYNDAYLIIPSKNEDETWKIAFKTNYSCLGTGGNDSSYGLEANAISCEKEESNLTMIMKDDNCFLLKDNSGNNYLEYDGSNDNVMEFDNDVDDADEFCFKTLDSDDNLIDMSLEVVESWIETFKLE